MSLMPTLLIGIWRVSAWPCTSSTDFTIGFLTGAATVILFPRRYAPNQRGSSHALRATVNGVDATPTCRCPLRGQKIHFKAISDHMGPKPRIPRILDDSPWLGSGAGRRGNRQAESAGGGTAGGGGPVVAFFSPQNTWGG